ncbi:hypothetical protein F4818DRAFT_436687 [Hypoxylon cercidicola]|nr:hypothetical protein F4818DRAFT_436687 [Hypoxylon cercidicola]
MPGEEMEITTDLGHTGFGEEIDIDLDFPVGQHDEDLELADFDSTQEIHNFNADTRDELMAEGDDASYGMIDADDIERNEAATTSNDIEIELGDPDDVLWEQNASHVEPVENDPDYIDYTDDKDIGDGGVGNISIVNVDPTECGAADKQPAIEFISEKQPIAQPNEDMAQPNEDMAQLNEDIAQSNEDNTQGSPRDSPHDSPAVPQHIPNVDEGPEAGAAEDNSVIVHEEHISTPAASVHSPVEEQLAEQLAKQLTEQPVEQAQLSEQDHTPEPTNGLSEDLSAAASRHTIYVAYHRVNYRLFAESEDDDPNTYFLSDMSALQFKLGEFLSSLRDVIAEEVSPLDELVLLIDGLGIEISESSPRELLDGFTFGDILSLYDRLVQNDGVESSTEVHLYLLLGPNCLKRLLALYDSAGAGRGLSEVGVYRDTTPAGESQAGGSQYGGSQYGESQVGESQAGESQAGESEPGTPSQSLHEPDHDDFEGDEGDNVKETKNGTDVKSPSVHTSAHTSAHTSVAGADTEDPAEGLEKAEDESEQKTGSIANESVDKDSADDLIDYSDDDLDLSLPQKGKAPNSHYPLPYLCSGTVDCLCDNCFDAFMCEPMDVDEKRPSSTSTTLEVSYRPDLNQSNVQWPVASVLGQQIRSPRHESLTPQFESLNLQAITNSHVLKDQQVNVSLGDSVQETLQESDGPTTAENSASNQHTSPFNGLNDVAVSEATSATATLTGDDKDEIDYSDDDDAEINRGGSNDPSNDDFPDNGRNDGPLNDGSSIGLVETPRLQIPDEGEITWESDDEDTKEELLTAPKDVVQVSPSTKRPRPDSDLSESETGPIDVKRRRSS